MKKLIRLYRPLAVTLLELLVVVLIISILATIATGVYTNQTQRARVAAAKNLIHQLSLAITRYETDTGALPPSGSGAAAVPGNAASRRNGSGYLHMALIYSMSGSANRPASVLWQGPYLNLQAEQLGPAAAGGALSAGMVDILDPWQGSVRYIAHQDYDVSSTSFAGGTRLFVGTLPTGANPNLPAPNPFFALGETFYNTNTYQLISFGPNGTSLGIRNINLTLDYPGGEADDVTNFGY